MSNDKRSEFEAQRENGAERYADIDRRTAYRSGFHDGHNAGWQAHAKSVASKENSDGQTSTTNGAEILAKAAKSQINREAIATVALDSGTCGTRRCCSNPSCDNDYPCSIHPEAESLSGGAPISHAGCLRIIGFLKCCLDSGEQLGPKYSKQVEEFIAKLKAENLSGHTRYADYRQEKLADPLNCAHYLMAAAQDSKEAFAYALKNINKAQAPSLEKAIDGNLFSEAIELLERARRATDSLHCMKAIEKFLEKVRASLQKHGVTKS